MKESAIAAAGVVAMLAAGCAQPATEGPGSVSQPAAAATSSPAAFERLSSEKVPSGAWVTRVRYPDGTECVTLTWRRDAGGGWTFHPMAASIDCNWRSE